MRLLTLATALIVVALSLTGCNLDLSSSPGGVAVLDLDQVGEKLGRLDLISKSINRNSQQQQTKFLQLQDKLRAQVANLKKSLGKKPTAKQLREFQQVSQAVDTQLQAALDHANQEIAQYKTNQIAAFREQAKPIAEQAAKARGLSIVMLRQEHYLWVDPAVDITQDVIDALSDSN